MPRLISVKKIIMATFCLLLLLMSPYVVLKYFRIISTSLAGSNLSNSEQGSLIDSILNFGYFYVSIAALLFITSILFLVFYLFRAFTRRI